MNKQSKSSLGRMLTLIEVPSSSLRFLILDCPTESTLSYYLEEFKRYQVTHVVRCCQPTYNSSTLSEQGIQVYDLPFKDGGVVRILIDKLLCLTSCLSSHRWESSSHGFS
jgi:protein tyrosine phosphatase type 4A